MKLNKRSLFSILISLSAIVTSLTIIFFAKGYQFNFDKKEVVKTGMIHATSIPEGASIYLNNALSSATNTTISNLNPGKYEIKIAKDGYYAWSKEILVEAELVTQIQALLLPSAPEIKPTIQDGVVQFEISPDNSKAAIFISNAQKSGIWILSFNNLPFGTGYSIKQIVKDRPDLKFSRSEITWSNDGRQILANPKVESATQDPKPTIPYLLDTERLNEEPDSTDNPAEIIDTWQKEAEILSAQRKNQLSEEALKIYPSDPNPIWSPDEQAFILKKDGRFQIYLLKENAVINLDGLNSENINYLVWHPDSRHLIFVENYKEDEGGKIGVVEIDGQNIMVAYEGFMSQPEFLISQDGDKLFFSTSFNRSANTFSLYYLNLR